MSTCSQCGQPVGPDGVQGPEGWVHPQCVRKPAYGGKIWFVVAVICTIWGGWAILRRILLEMAD